MGHYKHNNASFREYSEAAGNNREQWSVGTYRQPCVLWLVPREPHRCTHRVNNTKGKKQLRMKQIDSKHERKRRRRRTRCNSRTLFVRPRERSPSEAATHGRCGRILLLLLALGHAYVQACSTTHDQYKNTTRKIAHKRHEHKWRINGKNKNRVAYHHFRQSRGHVPRSSARCCTGPESGADDRVGTVLSSEHRHQ